MEAMPQMSQLIPLCTGRGSVGFAIVGWHGAAVGAVIQAAEGAAVGAVEGALKHDV